MIIYVVAAIAGIVLALTTLVALYRHHRTRPAVYHFVMAQHLWQPRKFK